MSRCSLCRWPLLAAAALTLLAAAPAQARVLDVTKRHVGFAHFTTIQRAVNAARSGDWIVIDRGVYPETVRIRTSNLHLRGVVRSGRQRHRGLQGEQRVGREPHRAQLRPPHQGR
jgi:pectin methylesterase-like acyl-CoA thioesterase